MTRHAPRWFEEFEPGQTFDTAGYTFTEGSIADFAFLWDPQPFHMDKTYAEQSIYGDIIASGFQTQLVAFRMVYQSGVFGHNRGGRGIDNLRWQKAVKAGDTIRVIVTIKAANPARTTGHLVVDYDIVNQHDETVMTATLNYVIAKRPTEG
jgi:acyl dehydratase